MDKYVFIYNLEQAYFYIENGIRPIYIDKHDRTGNIYFQFVRDDTREIYDKWLNNNK